MKRFFRFFQFNRLEQYGFTTLSALLILIWLVPDAIKLLRKEPPINHTIVYFEDTKDSRERKVKTDKKGYLTKNITYFPFDPNGLSAESWQKLGFSPKQIQVIKNYEAKGGRFFKKEDVAKIFVISTADYARIAPYIQIKLTKPQFIPAKGDLEKNASLVKRPWSKSVAKVNINLADTTDWKSLKGIGSVFARRIVKYKEALGGFVHIAQVAEVYGIPPETMDSIRPFLVLDPTPLVTKLNVNRLTAEELARHPYIGKKQAQTLINYRQQHGNFKNLESLQSIQSLDSIFFRKIEKYLEY